MSEPEAPRLVILDRDGVINYDSDDYIRSPDEWLPIPGSIEAIARLSNAGFRIAVATNQSGLARGYFDEITLANIHNLLFNLVENAGGQIDTLVYCPHGPNDGCSCRKPATGLMDSIESELMIPVAGAWFVGDSDKDMILALKSSCRPLLVRTGKGRQTEQAISKELLASITVVDDLSAASHHILSAG